MHVCRWCNPILGFWLFCVFVVCWRFLVFLFLLLRLDLDHGFQNYVLFAATNFNWLILGLIDLKFFPAEGWSKTGALKARMHQAPKSYILEARALIWPTHHGMFRMAKNSLCDPISCRGCVGVWCVFVLFVCVVFGIRSRFFCNISHLWILGQRILESLSSQNWTKKNRRAGRRACKVRYDPYVNLNPSHLGPRLLQTGRAHGKKFMNMLRKHKAFLPCGKRLIFCWNCFLF